MGAPGFAHPFATNMPMMGGGFGGPMGGMPGAGFNTNMPTAPPTGFNAPSGLGMGGPMPAGPGPSMIESFQKDGFNIMG
jgi:hypothetical protein